MILTLSLLMQPEESQVNISTLTFWPSSCVFPVSLSVRCIQFFSDCTSHPFPSLLCLYFRIKIMLVIFTSPHWRFQHTEGRQTESRSMMSFIFCAILCDFWFKPTTLTYSHTTNDTLISLNSWSCKSIVNTILIIHLNWYSSHYMRHFFIPCSYSNIKGRI